MIENEPMIGPATYFRPEHRAGLDERTRTLIDRREAVLSAGYRLFYAHPVEFVRGSGTKLYTREGDEYLDVYNNVPSVGHAHPRVTAAIAEQSALLNTHTRYVHEGLIDYAEMLLGSFTPGLDTLTLVCTGSEANDLALRVAKQATGHRGVIVTENAYHGVTTEIAAISPSLGGVGSLAEWVRTVRPPSGDGTAMVADARTAIAELQAAGHGVAALIVDTAFASDGFIAPSAETRAALAAAKQAAVDALAAVRDQDAQRAARSEQVSRARAQAEAAEAEAARLASGVDSAQESVREAESGVERAQAEYEEFAGRPRPMLDASARDALLADLEAARAAELERRIELETARERVRAAVEGAELLEKRRIAEKAAADESARRAVLRQRQVRQATAVAAALPAVQSSIDRSVAEARVALAQRESERAAQNDELLELRRTESSLRERLATITEGVHGLELQIYEKKLHLSQLLERAGDELGLVEEVLVAEYGPDVPVPDDDALTEAARAVADAIAAEAAARVDPDPDAPAFDPTSDEEAARVAEIVAQAAAHPFATHAEVTETGPDGAHSGVQPELRTEPAGKPFDRTEQQARLARAERKLSQLGRVNPLALEEFAALEQRHKFLTEQLTDLANTRRDLLTIIDEVDATMQTIFAAAFADTQAAFDVVFPILFPGGTGSLTLTDPENMLTTGIEVTVKPAGKKIERLSLLSGGERSLAAVALLIAIFKARPSPFYIMDEVEAALDDANLGRLLTIFRDLRQNSQLIIITHQKRTMEIADALYGVSMRQDGVSAVVGQRVQAPDERAS